jgi:hypothetical protein
MCLVRFPAATLFIIIFNWLVLIVATVSVLCKVGSQFVFSVQIYFLLKGSVRDSGGWSQSSQLSGFFWTKWPGT